MSKSVVSVSNGRLLTIAVEYSLIASSYRCSANSLFPRRQCYGHACVIVLAFTLLLIMLGFFLAHRVAAQTSRKETRRRYPKTQSKSMCNTPLTNKAIQVHSYTTSTSRDICMVHTVSHVIMK